MNVLEAEAQNKEQTSQRKSVQQKETELQIKIKKTKTR